MTTHGAAIAVAVVLTLAVVVIYVVRKRRIGAEPPVVIHWDGSAESFSPEARHWPLAAIAMVGNELRPWNTLRAIGRGDAVQALATS